MPLPSISGMDPPFGDAFENYTFADQVLTSTDLLASNSDPDFMYELDTEMTCRQSPRAEIFSLGDCKEVESIEQLSGMLDSDPACNSNFEQWDTYWEDLTKYTKLTSCDIWGTKEVDFLGLDDFSSPYQDEEVIRKTPTLAQLNSEDSQPVSDALCCPELLLSQKTPALPTSSHNKKMTSKLANQLADFAEGSQIATWPVPSSTEIMSKAESLEAKGTSLHSGGKDYVCKAKVRIGVPRQHPAVPAQPQAAAAATGSPFMESSVAVSSTTDPSAGAPAASVSVSVAVAADPGTLPREKRAEKHKLDGASMSENVPLQVVERIFPGAGGNQSLPQAGALGPDFSREKEEEHNYSLFVTQAKLAGKPKLEDEDEEDDDEEEEEVEEEGEGELEEAELDDEDHDEGFGSEHEFSENEEEEDEEEEDYDDDKDDDMSDSFSEQGCENDPVDDMKGFAAGLSRKRGKRRYFWEYSEQLAPSKQERMLKPSEWDRDTLPSNMYQRNGLHYGKHAVKKSRRTDVEDLTPNPRKLLQIGNELHKLNKVISDLTPVNELPLTARPRSRKEKNKLASRACRLKKKAQYEANKVKLWGLNTEYDRLLFVINGIKEKIVSRVQDLAEDEETSMAEKLGRLIEETLVKSPVAGQTSDFVNRILENTAAGDPTGGLVGLRVPTSKV